MGQKDYAVGERRRRRSPSAPSDDDPERRDRRRRRERTDHDRSRSRERGHRSRHDDDGRRHREKLPRRSQSPMGSRPTRELSYKHRSSYSRSPPRQKPSRSKSPSQAVVAQTSNDAVDTAPEKQKPNFAQTGALAAETNTFAGVVLKYHEPAEARKPPTKDAWRLYIFKGSDLLETVELGPRSCWLVGRERLVVDFPVDHPSCSKQHAVIQFRHVTKTNEYGDKDGRVRPYIIDLDSANGTSVNGDRIPATRYVELQDKDMIQFGLSTREYVLMLPPRD